MHLCERTNYRIKRHSPDSCKQLLRFEDESIDFVAYYFLNDVGENHGGALSKREKVDIVLQYLS